MAAFSSVIVFVVAIAFTSSLVAADKFIFNDYRVVAVSAGNANDNNKGWIQFCPKGTDINTLLNIRDPPNECVSIRPMAYTEQDATGSVVTGNTAASVSTMRYMSNLFHAMTVSDAETIVMPKCNLTMANWVLCGNSNPGNGDLRAQRMPITVDLGSVARGTVTLTAYVFLDAGVLTFDGRTYLVNPGTAKFDLSVNNYAFAASGSFITLRFMVQSSYRRPEFVTVGSNSSGFGLINDNDIECLPRYAIEKTVGDNLVWQSASISRVILNGDAYVEMRFNGPFVNMEYDPFVGTSRQPDSTPAVAKALGAGSDVISKAPSATSTLLSVTMALSAGLAVVSFVV